MATIVFQVPDSVADEMRRQGVYLDIFGYIRWTNTAQVVKGSSRWEVR